MKKFELTAEYVTNSFGKKLFRIKALVAFGDVKEGDLGGFVEKESNLANSGKAWVCGDAQVSGDARVFGDARVSGDAQVSCDLDYATVGGFGSEQRTSTFFIRKDGAIGVICGCFCGTIEQFRAKVKKTHKDSKYAQEYLMIANLMELHFARGKEDDER